MRCIRNSGFLDTPEPLIYLCLREIEYSQCIIWVKPAFVSFNSPVAERSAEPGRSTYAEPSRSTCAEPGRSMPG
jgi:hypothetical protein